MRSWCIPLTNLRRRWPPFFQHAWNASPHEPRDDPPQTPGGSNGASNVQPSAVTVGNGFELIVNPESHRSRVERPTPVPAHTEGLAEEPLRSDRATPRAHQFDPIAVPREDPNPVRLFTRIFRDVHVGQIGPPRADGPWRSVDVKREVEIERSADSGRDRGG